MSEKLKLEVLMSAMHQDNFDIENKTKINSDLLIINQCDKDDYVEMTVDGHLWRMISTTERGLSKSRNMALENAKGDIFLCLDSDEILNSKAIEIIINDFFHRQIAIGKIATETNMDKHRRFGDRFRYSKLERKRKTTAGRIKRQMDNLLDRLVGKGMGVGFPVGHGFDFCCYLFRGSGCEAEFFTAEQFKKLQPAYTPVVNGLNFFAIVHDQ